MPETALGPFKLDAWPRSKMVGMSGPVYAKGKVTLFGFPAPALVGAALLPEAADTPLAFALGLTGPDGVYRVPVSIAGKGLSYGSYRLRQVALPFLGPPLLQDVPVSIGPDVFVGALISAAGGPGTIRNELVYANLGYQATRWYLAGAVMRPVGALAVPEIEHFTRVDPYLAPPPVVLPPGLDYEELVRRAIGQAGIAVELGTALDVYGAGDVIPSPELLPCFDPDDPLHLSQMDDVKGAMAFSPEMRHARLMALVPTVEWMSSQLFVFNETSPPFIDWPPGMYDGFNAVAQEWDSVQRVLSGWASWFIWPAVWEKPIPVAAAAIVSVRWWVED